MRRSHKQMDLSLAQHMVRLIPYQMPSKNQGSVETRPAAAGVANCHAPQGSTAGRSGKATRVCSPGGGRPIACRYDGGRGGGGRGGGGGSPPGPVMS